MGHNADEQELREAFAEGNIDWIVSAYQELEKEFILLRDSQSTLEVIALRAEVVRLNAKCAVFENDWREEKHKFGLNMAQICQERENAKAEAERLRAWKESALALEATWDEQAVAHELKIGLGLSIRDKILLSIKNLRIENERLKEEIKKITHSKREPFAVKCDESNNSPEDAAAGRINMEVTLDGSEVGHQLAQAFGQEADGAPEEAGPPKYARLGQGGCAMVLQGSTYYRHAGAWKVRFKCVDDGYVSVEPYHSSLNGHQLIACTKEEWLEDNGDWATGKKHPYT